MQSHPLKNNYQPMPGDLAIWFFIYAELAVFGLAFIVYLVIKSQNPEIFEAGQQTLNKAFALINTLALITSSYFVVKAVESIKQDSLQACGHWLIAALVAASIYVLLKTLEYQHLYGLGFHLSSNKFYTYYFLLTMFHYAHVLLGMAILFIILMRNRKRAYSSNDYSMLEVGASYWHMVDLVWVVLFPLVYVIQ
jgi:nitric oxide reductase NorE protein